MSDLFRPTMKEMRFNQTLTPLAHTANLIAQVKAAKVKHTEGISTVLEAANYEQRNQPTSILEIQKRDLPDNIQAVYYVYPGEPEYDLIQKDSQEDSQELQEDFTNLASQELEEELEEELDQPTAQ